MKMRRKHIRPLISVEITLKEARLLYERHFNRELESEKSYASAAYEVRDAIGTDEFVKRLVALREEEYANIDKIADEVLDDIDYYD